MNNQQGRAVLETLIELIVALLILPQLICCLTQGVALILGIVLPWLVLVTIALGAAVCIGAGLIVRQRERLAPGDDLHIHPLPLRRPPEIPDQHD